MWVTMPTFLPCHLITWAKVCELGCHFLWQDSLISHPMVLRKWVTMILFFVSLLITWDSITHSKWVTVLFFPEGSLIIYYPWPIVCQWHFCQAISNFITSHCMTNRKWVTLPLFTCILFHVKWQYVCDTTLSSAHYILLCATACKWHCPIFLCDTLIRSHSMTNSEWVAMPFVSVRKSHHI